ncbi:hypothetical protein [Deinococcus pimensis]|uniref:hypothetical protein n=1 Tax=Deinococcus pimensis TaxID=309888 RepID=UPI000482EDF6|nr:hypothetical protein [Deinococcus pimensis]
MRPGDVINESVLTTDEVTGRDMRRLTTTGTYNETPTYHLNTAFTPDGRFLLLATAREGHSALLRADVTTGDLTVLAVTDGVGIPPFSDTMTFGPHTTGSLGGGYTGTFSALTPDGQWALASVGRQLHAVHLHTLETRVLIEDLGRAHRLHTPAGTRGGRVVAALSPAHPDLAAGATRAARPYMDALTETHGGMPSTFIEVDLHTGARRDVHHDPVAGCNHVQPSPTDDDLWLIDRDLPPRYWGGGDGGRTSRCWLLRPSTGVLTEIRPRDAQRFVVHTNWSHDGTLVYYHGLRGDGVSHYVGAARADTAEVVWERVFPRYHYGHVSSHPTRNAIVTDGLVTADLVTFLDFEHSGPSGAPHVEVLARHATRWDALAGQFPHPHPHVSPDGRWLSYNRGQSHGRSDVYLTCLHD